MDCKRFGVTILPFAFLMGCSHGGRHKEMMEGKSMAKEARAVLMPLGANSAKADVAINASGCGCELKLQIKAKGLKPNSKHGIHIHEFGDCSSNDGSSAGGHFNPTGKAHGGPSDKDHHVGDLGNLIADSKGEARSEISLSHVHIHDLAGRAIVVHHQEDDFKTQPSGGSGDRIACGVIGVTK